MPLDKKKLMAHLTAASKAKAPATPAKPASIKQAEMIEQQVKKAVGVDKVEKEAEQVTKADSIKNADHSSPDAKAVAETYLSKALMKKLTTGEKLSADDQKAVAAVCRVVGYLQ